MTDPADPLAHVRADEAMVLGHLVRRDEVAALVRAIRRAHDGEQYGGVVMFTVRDIHEFAQRLVREGVTVQQEKAA